MKNIISFLFITITILALGFFANKTYQNAIEYEKISTQIASENMIAKKLDEKPQNLLGSFLGALLGQKPAQKKEKINLKDKKEDFKNKTENNLFIFSSILFASLFLYFILSKVLFLLYLNLASLLSLGFGIFTPIFSILIQKDLPIVGYVVLDFDSNTLLSSIEKLFSQENYFVGGIIFLFSIMFPLIKILIMSLALFVKNATLIKVTKISSILSKWSMLDVFVLAIFLVYLSTSKSNTIVSEIQVGFYMFFSYVILALISSTIYNLGIKK